VELTGQVVTFIMTIATGILLGTLFDCYRVLRSAFTPQTVITWFTDLLYWFIATVVVFIALVLSNWGELRFYVFIGILGGLGLYYKWLSVWAIRFLSSGIQVFIKAIRIMKKIIIITLIKPGMYCIGLISWPLGFLWNKVITRYRTWHTTLLDEEKKQ
jgi:spore cortex biosynthesis protein YabQ